VFAMRNLLRRHMVEWKTGKERVFVRQYHIRKGVRSEFCSLAGYCSLPTLLPFWGLVYVLDVECGSSLLMMGLVS
jgi:hypothetical protein